MAKTAKKITLHAGDVVFDEQVIMRVVDIRHGEAKFEVERRDGQPPWIEQEPGKRAFWLTAVRQSA